MTKSDEHDNDSPTVVVLAEPARAHENTGGGDDDSTNHVHEVRNEQSYKYRHPVQGKREALFQQARGKDDKPMQRGTRVEIHMVQAGGNLSDGRYERGTVVGFHRNLWGANEYTIEFDALYLGTTVVKLREKEWRVLFDPRRDFNDDLVDGLRQVCVGGTLLFCCGAWIASFDDFNLSPYERGYREGACLLLPAIRVHACTVCH